MRIVRDQSYRRRISAPWANSNWAYKGTERLGPVHYTLREPLIFRQRLIRISRSEFSKGKGTASTSAILGRRYVGYIIHCPQGAGPEWEARDQWRNSPRAKPPSAIQRKATLFIRGGDREVSKFF